MSGIAASLDAVRKGIAQALAGAGRESDAVTLIAVSKTRPAALIGEAIAAGQLDFGENYAQELRDKMTEVDDARVRWHFIGHLQGNKVKHIAARVTMIHSVDSLKLAEEISRHAQRLGRVIQILIQLNLAHEATKSGVDADELEGLIRAAASLPGVKVCGLMTMPPYFDDPETGRPFYRQLREIRDQMQSRLAELVVLKELSMGMSHDYHVAVSEGATMVRVGTAIFGERG